MSRVTYNRTAADWGKVVDAVRHAGGGHITLPTLDLTLILHGYRQLTAEREEALTVLDTWHRQGLIDSAAVLDMQRALGVISQEQYDEQVRAASAASSAVSGVDTTREGCVDHIPVASGSCRECAQAQGVTL